MAKKSSDDPRADRDDRLAYFDSAGQYTPYLATAAGGAMFLVKTEDKHIGRSLFSKQARGEFSVLGRAVGAIKGMIGPEAITHRSFVDVGANIGTTTIAALVSHGFDRAIAIEPEPENVLVLRLNILLNDVQDRVDVLPIAASSEAGHSELVVNPERGGKHWIATDRTKLKRKSLEGESQILKVETKTLDGLVEAGVIDAEATGLLWMDAESHEGHILEGASSLLARGTPLVIEMNPLVMERAGDPDKLERAISDNYTHFAGMHRDPDPEHARFPLHPVSQLDAYAETFLEPGSPAKTDILLLRLSSDQAERVTELDAFVKSGSRAAPAT